MTTTLPAPVTIGSATRLTPDLLERAAAGPLAVRLDPATRRRVGDCHRFLLRCLAEGRPVYGATTGFGALVGLPGRADAADQCESLLDHLTAGQGDDLPFEVVRATLLARLWALAKGHSGAREQVLDALVAALDTGFAPAVPELGSVGASGDLVPTAHLVRGLRGEGHAHLAGRRLPAAEALRRAGLTPIDLAGRDALALVNGTSFTAAAAGLALAQLTRSLDAALRLTALLAELLGSTPDFADPSLLTAYHHPDASAAGDRLRALLAGTTPSGERPLQEPYSIRCAPQLLGAAMASARHAASVIEDDLNGISDNPLFFPEEDKVCHGGNFFGQPVAFAADLLSLAAVQTANLAERQLDLLLDPHRNGGRNPLLAADPGSQHGLAGVQLTATAITAQMRRTATPASVQSLPTNLHNQDIVPFGTQAALGAYRQARALRLLHGSLALALRQAAHLGDRLPTAPACAAELDRLAEALPPVSPDRPLAADVRLAADLLDAAGEPPRPGRPSI
ncbi:HAL/PAL/TAL family ammonia-lyase [Streptomyces millisiae]|uniref:Aromatic amino acid ammonia-lyase n=1 Tax=Streptomyces millisiae TaxID=3075542 RepID=A0ABU2LIF6_9ACTN|nr:aromatic amino acid ammonia-lyase [Streptomyces sp. DSM 44918]MDT0317357.1 aromatic amino acid ammonia-lyase [Streptomyces sp. DSM 44918]